jgi:hypothetical protein
MVLDSGYQMVKSGFKAFSSLAVKSNKKLPEMNKL